MQVIPFLSNIFAIGVKFGIFLSYIQFKITKFTKLQNLLNWQKRINLQERPSTTPADPIGGPLFFE